MPKVKFVKKAREDNLAVQKGEPYYWWSFRYGGKRYSKTYPKASQLTQSSFLSGVYSIQEEMSVFLPEAEEDIQTNIDDWVSSIEDLKSECEDSLSNIPDQLQDGSVGQMLQERIEAMDQWIDNLRNIDTDKQENQHIVEFLNEKVDEINSHQPEV